jgi:ABC-type transporter Mla subunit MlaD
MVNNNIKNTDSYASDLRNTYDEIKTLENEIKTLNPEKIRKNYDKYWNIVNDNEKETNESIIDVNESLNNLEDDKELIEKKLEDVNESINNLEDSKELLEKIYEIIQNVKKTINSFRIGTLQGITRQTIKENNMTVNPNDEIGQTVLIQKYDELKDINRNKGGTKKYNKKYNRKSKRKRSRSNKYK